MRLAKSLLSAAPFGSHAAGIVSGRPPRLLLTVRALVSP
jgi:hypothetical protein